MNRFLLVIYSIGISFSAGIIGSIFTVSEISTWYQFLEKPIFTPPNWVFGPVWNTLYLLMGISLYLVLVSKKSKNRTVGLKLFYLQLVLNTVWSIIFFGMHNILLGVIVILFLWSVIFLMIKKIMLVNKAAGSLLLPYIIWVTIATLLNIGIFILNY